MIIFCDQTNEQLTATIQEDLDIRLGLNGTFYQKGNNNKYDTRTRLVERRREAYEFAMNVIEQLKENGMFTRKKLQHLIDKEEANPQEFSGVFLFVYRRELYKSAPVVSGIS